MANAAAVDLGSARLRTHLSEQLRGDALLRKLCDR
jgi:hypothetical protein